MSAEEFGLWLAFNEVDPIGPSAFRLAVAQLRTGLANGPLKPRPGRNGLSTADFYPTERWQPQPEKPQEPTLDEIALLFTPKARR